MQFIILLFRYKQFNSNRYFVHYQFKLDDKHISSFSSHVLIMNECKSWWLWFRLPSLIFLGYAAAGLSSCIRPLIYQRIVSTTTRLEGKGQGSSMLIHTHTSYTTQSILVTETWPTHRLTPQSPKLLLPLPWSLPHTLLSSSNKPLDSKDANHLISTYSSYSSTSTTYSSRIH